MADLLLYWRRDTADANVERGGLLNHAASWQLGRVKTGDSVWIVTVRVGELFLLGRIVVQRVTDQATAVNALGDSDLWDAPYHILAERGTAHPIMDVSIPHLAEQLRFLSTSDRSRLAVTNDTVNAQQLQTMRILTAESAHLLEQVLNGEIQPAT